jgi:hypothetical protein
MTNKHAVLHINVMEHSGNKLLLKKKDTQQREPQLSRDAARLPATAAGGRC